MPTLLRCITPLVVFVLGGLFLPSSLAATPKNIPSPGAPAAFERNVGQALYDNGQSGRQVDAVLRLGPTMAYVHASGLDIMQQVVHRGPSRNQYEQDVELDVVRADMRLIASNPDPRVEFLQPQHGTVRYITAKTGVEGIVADRFGAIVYHDVWPGVDMRLYLTHLGLKYDFLVHPGADPSQIAFRYDGTSVPTLDEDGNLLISTPLGSLNEQAPVVFTSDAEGVSRTPVGSRYVVSGSSVRFRLDGYDRSKILVIDPQRVWATYYGGNNSFESVYTAVDLTGNVILAGTTIATNMPSSVGVLQRRLKAGMDGYVAKFNESGAFQWHTYYGGSLIDRLNDVTTDGKGNIWTCGQSNSKDRPEAVNGLLGSSPLGDPDSVQGADAIVLKLAPDGKWSDSWEVYGRENDIATGIAVSATRVAVVGYTKSPRLGGLFGEAPWRKDTANFGVNFDMFVSVVKLKTPPSPTRPEQWVHDYLIFYGGGGDDIGGKIAFDKQANVLFSGYSFSTNFPVTDGTTNKGYEDICVVKFSPTATRIWASMFGSSDFEDLGDLAVDSKGDVVVVGTTYGTNLPTSSPLKAAKTGTTDGFIRKYTSAGTVAWSTFYGGDSADVLRGVAVDRADNIWISGTTGRSLNIPVTADAIQSAPYATSVNGSTAGTDGFVGKLNPAGTIVLYGSYLGAPPQDTLPKPPAPPPAPPPPLPPPNTDFGTDELFDVATDNNAYVVFTGRSTTYRMTTTAGAYQDSSALAKDTIRANPYVTLFSQCKDSIIAIIPNGPSTLCDVDSRQLVGPKGFARYLWSTGDTTQNIIVRDSGSYVLLCTTADGCRYRDTIYIGRNPKPSVSAGRDTSVCIRSSVALTATPSGGTSPYRYKWNRIETGQEFIDNDTLQSPNVSPGTSSRYEVTVTDSAGCSAKDTVLVTVTDPKPTVGTPMVDFGTIDGCASSAEVDVTIVNPQAYEVRITGFVPDDPRLSLLTSVSPGIAVAPGASATIRLRISATSAGQINGTFAVSGTPCSWTAPGKYTAKKDQLTASITPGVVSFGAGVVCDAAEKLDTAVITNSGKVDLIVKPAVVAAPFALVTPTTEVTLKPGERHDVVFKYTPTVGIHTSDIVFGYESGPCKDSLRVRLNAVTSEVTAAVTPSSVNGGTLSGCENQKDTTITIDNTSNVAVTVSLPTDAEIVYTPAGPIEIAAKSSVQVAVSLRPGTAGLFNRTHDLTIEPCKAKASVSYTIQKNGIAFTTPSSVDFGEFSACTAGTSTQRSASLSFDGTGTATIKTVATGPRIATSLSNGQTLTSGQAAAFTVTWTPTADGPLVDSIVVTFDPCNVRRVIRLSGTRTSVALRSDNATVSLGAITGTASGKVKYTNTGTDTIFVGVSSKSVGTAVDAAVPGPLVGLLPGAEVLVDFTTACRDRSVISDTLECAVLRPCAGVTAQSVITATCAKTTVVSSTVSLDTVSVKVGDQFIVPLRLRASQGLNAAGASSWRATISYDPSVIVGRANTTDCWLPNTAGPCSITIQGTRGADTVGTLFALNYTAVLGSTDRSALTLTDFQWVGVQGATTEKRNGLVTIKDICREGGDRYLVGKSNGYGVRVYPTPASSDVTIDIKGLGADQLRWTLSTMLGEVVADGVGRADASGALQVSIDVSPLGAGTYTITTAARGDVQHLPFVIQR